MLTASTIPFLLRPGAWRAPGLTRNTAASKPTPFYAAQAVLERSGLLSLLPSSEQAKISGKIQVPLHKDNVNQFSVPVST